jgi:hypothetical protein
VSDTDQLDDLWRDALRDLADVGDGAGAPGRVQQQLRARARRRRTLHAASIACLALLIGATAVALAHGGGRDRSSPPVASDVIVGTITVTDQGLHLAATAPGIALQGNPPVTAPADGVVTLQLPRPGVYRFVINGDAGHVIALDGQAPPGARTPGEVIERYLAPGRHSLSCTIPGHAAAGERIDFVIADPSTTERPTTVDATVRVALDNGAVRLTSGTSSGPSLAVVPGNVRVVWDGDRAVDSSRSYVPDASLRLDVDGARLARGQDIVFGAPVVGAYPLRVMRGDAVVAEGVLLVEEPSVDPVAASARQFDLVYDLADHHCKSWSNTQPDALPIRVVPGGYTFTFKDGQARPFTVRAGTWQVSDRHEVKLDLPVGRYTIDCPEGTSIALVVGE